MSEHNPGSPGPAEHGPRGAIAWMAGNTVAANLFMAVFLVGGLFMVFNIKQEVFPEFSLDTVSISVAYPGASPEEVESGIILAVEEAVRDLEGIDEITSEALEGSASVIIEALDGADVTRLWQEIKSEVDRIDTFPDEAEDPVVTITSRQREVVRLALYGNAPETTMRDLADDIRDRFLSDPAITQVALEGVREREILVEISTNTLRRYGMTLSDVADAISTASVELGGGAIKSGGGDILLRIKSRKDYARQYAKLPIFTREDGSQLVLSDIATVREGFEDSDTWASFNGKRAVTIAVYRVGKQTPTQVADATQKMLKIINADLPEGIHLSIVRDMSKIFVQRADLLLGNAYLGLGLVFLCLALFLEIRLAFWVSVGIPISFLGSFLFLAATDFTINMVSMFAFIVTLGIVVDDAVVVGENIYYCRRQGMGFLEASIQGARSIAVPVFFSVITNMVTFMPIMFIPGIMGKIFKSMPLVVVAVFGVSLIESLFILPAHLSHASRPLFFPLNILEAWQGRFSAKFETTVKSVYGRVLSVLLSWRYTVFALGLALLLITFGYVKSGKMGMVLFPKVESDYAYCEIYLPYGTPESKVRQVETHLVASAQKTVDENGKQDLSTGIFSQVSENSIQARIYLTDPHVRPISTSEVTRIWREKTGSIPSLETITFEANRGGPGSGKSLTIALSHRDADILNRAGEDLALRLGEYPMVSDIDDGSAQGKRQFDITLTPAGHRMGLTPETIAGKIRSAYQGIEAVKNQRGRNEVTVRVRLAADERISETAFENYVLNAPNGEIMLRDAIKTIKGRAYTVISRSDGRREIQVSANVTPQSMSENIIGDMKQEILPSLMKGYPGLSYEFKGKQADLKESVGALVKGLGLSLFCVFALLAIPFKSYFQPLIIMLCIPFGIIGAVAGHIIMGYSLSVMSLFGVVAMSGVVINDSLVLIDFSNRLVRGGMPVAAAVRAAGIQRFRPILLTTLTTCGGLAPIIMETSRQAKFLIPMAISLGFGILFATVITLGLVPCLYLILEDIKDFFQNEKEQPL
ncbi:AcrB/AcrD/AcrF family protein [Desulfobacter hydrogenophilus]|uniref:AcrB/AcrD/AcrF family protein n=1 Tax=Desulfobacter hydrogenophilus TaxID=2291 RepID=A0A328FGA3_9BACT|nr:efflux RND transporter permease subunit [Desulfobacter hydrogenophilus]NDY71982.1 efflux RND transporter permease subunit [Desulfobacter hydrogenophilus]QBH12326.1 efflux RND transporter permease subunit [Desulfobacter hydrogenophilus]RAM02073.1 AcrB/AcrD/AcrF family protein [Desulfobacter hydrogenophilus]